MRDQNDNEKEMNECPHCKRVNWLSDEMEEMGYELGPEDLAAIDGLLDIYFYPFLMKMFGEIELLRCEYADKHDEEKILGNYQKQLEAPEKKEEEDGKSETKKDS
jgi:hypothetical protein